MPPPRCLTGTPRTTSLGTNRPQVITKLPDATQGLPGLRFKSQHSKITFHTALILFVQKRWHWRYCISVDTMPVKWMYKKLVSNKEVKLSLIKITRGPFPIFLLWPPHTLDAVCLAAASQESGRSRHPSMDSEDVLPHSSPGPTPPEHCPHPRKSFNHFVPQSAHL